MAWKSTKLRCLLLIAVAIACAQGVPFKERPEIRCLSTRLDKAALLSEGDCEAMCDESAECGAYTYKPKPSGKNGTCWLMEDCEKNIYGAKFNSGIKYRKPALDYNLYPDLECTGTSIDPFSATSVEACRQLCDDHEICHSWTYRADSKRCYLKDDCDERFQHPAGSVFYSGVNKYNDIDWEPSETSCPLPRANCKAKGGKVCPSYSESSYESTDLDPEDIDPSPYQDILEGVVEFSTTYPEVRDYPTCPFRPPNDPVKANWAQECIKNLRKVGLSEDIYARPNPECPAGFFLCRGMCYTLVQRYNRGPERGPSYYAPDYMGVEARCGTCGGARVAFMGEEEDFKLVAAEAARQTINEDRATWVRRFRFLDAPSAVSEAGKDPYQPWHRYVTMIHESPERMTYQRFYTGEKDDLDEAQYDVEFRNQEASILCVNTIERIQAAVRTINSGLTMEDGCAGEDRWDKWDDDKHRWWPEHNWPFPGH